MRNTYRRPMWAIILIALAILTAAGDASSQSVVWKGHREGVSSIVLSPDAQMLASGGNDNTVRLWDVQTGRLEQTFEGHSRAISALAFSPDGQILASGSFDQSVKLWDVPSRKLKLAPGEHPSGQVKGVSFSPDGKFLASAGADGVMLWDLGIGKLLQFFESTQGVLTVAFSPDGKILAVAGGAGVKLWDLQKRKLSRHLLTGDLVHFQHMWDNKVVPPFNFNKEQSLASIERIVKLLAKHKAQLWIGHDKDITAKIDRAPKFYE